MNKNKAEQSFWQDKISLLKRVGFIAFASTIALSMPAVSDVLSKVSPLSNLGVSAAAAQTNLMNSSDILTQFHQNHNEDKEHWSHTFDNDGDMNVSGPDFDLTDLKYVVKFPDALSHLLNDEYVTEYLFGNVTNFDSPQSPFMITGHVIDENGDKVTINKDQHKPYNYISINKATNSIEFDFNRFYTENKLKPSINTNVNGEYIFENLGFETPIIVPDSRILDNGTYGFKSAIVRGKSVNLDNVTNAHSENLIVDYSSKPEPVVDSKDLEALVVVANGYESVDYTETSFEALTKAVKAANDVVGNEAATQEQVDAAKATLQKAIDGLVEVEIEVPVEADKEKLEALVGKANKFDAGDYTTESFSDLTEKIAGAEVVLADEAATEGQVVAAFADLQVAIAGLEKIKQPAPEIDKGELEALVTEANNFDAEDYTQESFSDLTETVVAAEVVLADEAATQEQIDAALADLQVAINGLEAIIVPEPVIDTSKLEALIDDAKDFDANDYTADTFAALTSAIEEANATLGNELVTQEQIDFALTELQAAIDGLVKAEKPESEEPKVPGDEGNKGNNGNNGDEGKTNSGENPIKVDHAVDGTRLPNTATNMFSLLLVGSILSLSGGLLIFYRRKKLANF